MFLKLFVFATATAALIVPSCTAREEITATLGAAPLATRHEAPEIVETAPAAAAAAPAGLDVEPPAVTVTEPAAPVVPATVVTAPAPVAVAPVAAPAKPAPATPAPKPAPSTTAPAPAVLPTAAPFVAAGSAALYGPNYHDGRVYFVLQWAGLPGRVEGCSRIEAAARAAGINLFYGECGDYSPYAVFEGTVGSYAIRVDWFYDEPLYYINAYPL